MKKLNKIKSQSTAIPENQGNCRRAFLRFTTTLHCTKCFAKEATKQNFLFVESLHPITLYLFIIRYQTLRVLFYPNVRRISERNLVDPKALHSKKITNNKKTIKEQKGEIVGTRLVFHFEIIKLYIRTKIVFLS